MKLDDNIVLEIEDGILSYTPPFPERAKFQRSLFELLPLYRSNLLSIFDENDYKRRYGRRRILCRELILCNTPDLVQEAFITQHEIFQQKTAQMEQSLKPLIDDGLFISYGELWKTRRAAVAPIVHANKVSNFAPIMCETIQGWGDSWRKRKNGDENI